MRLKTKKGEVNVANDKGKQENRIIEKIVVERKYTNEITPALRDVSELHIKYNKLRTRKI